MTQEEKRKRLATLMECRSALYQCGMITEAENKKIYQRISRWQDKNKVSITRKQLMSVEITYNDNA